MSPKLEAGREQQAKAIKLRLEVAKGISVGIKGMRGGYRDEQLGSTPDTGV